VFANVTNRTSIHGCSDRLLQRLSHAFRLTERVSSVASKPSFENRVLAHRCLAGDRQAQVQLYRAEVRKVHALLSRVLGSDEAMDDLVQETFIRIFASLPRYRGDALLSTWIGRIALHVAYDHLRRRHRQSTRLTELDLTAVSSADIDHRFVAREGLRRLYGILDTLDPKVRIAFTLHVIDGRPHAEVASLMSATQVATRTRVWRARREVLRQAKRDPLLATFAIHEPESGS
jgi:RNA polymerase sigma-70 factor (ECF subfamily)